MPLALFAGSRQSLSISIGRATTMSCQDRLRLQPLYEVSLRRWAQIAAPSQLFGQPTYVTDDIRQRVLADKTLQGIASLCTGKTAKDVFAT
jgi:hypothetical protein